MDDKHKTPADRALTPDEFEIDEGIAENIRLGYCEVVGRDEKGDALLRLTEKGRAAAVALIQKMAKP